MGLSHSIDKVRSSLENVTVYFLNKMKLIESENPAIVISGLFETIEASSLRGFTLSLIIVSTFLTHNDHLD